MEHPLINNVQDLTLEQLQDKITELQKKYSFAARHNRHLASQILMALETFQNQYKIKQQELYNKSQSSGQDFSDRIDIT